MRNSQAGNEGGENEPLHATGVFQAAQQFVAGAAAARFPRSQAASDQLAAFEKIEHALLCVTRRCGRPMLLVGVDNGTDQLVPHDIPLSEINTWRSRARS